MTLRRNTGRDRRLAPYVPAFGGPKAVPGLVGWWSADQNVTGTTTVTAIGDLSGNGNTLSNGGGTASPSLVTAAYNARNALRFNGVQYLRAASPGAGTAWAAMVVVKMNSLTAAHNVAISEGGVGTNQGFALQTDGTNTNRDVQTAGFADWYDGPANTTTLEIWGFRMSGPSGGANVGNFWVNGTKQLDLGAAFGYGTITSAGFLEIGDPYGVGTRSFDFVEGAIWHAYPSDSDWANLFRYFAKGTGITVP